MLTWQDAQAAAMSLLALLACMHEQQPLLTWGMCVGASLGSMASAAFCTGGMPIATWWALLAESSSADSKRHARGAHSANWREQQLRNGLPGGSPAINPGREAKHRPPATHTHLTRGCDKTSPPTRTPGLCPLHQTATAGRCTAAQ